MPCLPVLQIRIQNRTGFGSTKAKVIKKKWREKKIWNFLFRKAGYSFWMAGVFSRGWGFLHLGRRKNIKHSEKFFLLQIFPRFLYITILGLDPIWAKSLETDPEHYFGTNWKIWPGNGNTVPAHLLLELLEPLFGRRLGRRGPAILVLPLVFHLKSETNEPLTYHSEEDFT
jgi:hypothetical protein